MASTTTLALDPLAALAALCGVIGPATPRARRGDPREEGSGRQSSWQRPIAVAVAIASCVDALGDDGWLRVSTRAIADRCGVSVRTVRSALDELERCGVLMGAPGAGSLPDGWAFRPPAQWSVRWAGRTETHRTQQASWAAQHTASAVFHVQPPQCAHDGSSSARPLGSRTNGFLARPQGSRTNDGLARPQGSRTSDGALRGPRGRAVRRVPAQLARSEHPRTGIDASGSAGERASELTANQRAVLDAITHEIDRLAREPHRHGRGRLVPNSAPHRAIAEAIASVPTVDLGGALQHLRSRPADHGPPVLAVDVADYLRASVVLADVEVPEPKRAPDPEAAEQRRRLRLAELVDDYGPDDDYGPVVDPLEQLRAIRNNQPPEVGTA